jgi:hypothetical protein
MSTPIRPEPDAFSLTLRRIEDRLDGIEKRLDGIDHRLDRLEVRFRRLLGGLYPVLIAGLSVLGWLVTRR